MIIIDRDRLKTATNDFVARSSARMQTLPLYKAVNVLYPQSLGLALNHRYPLAPLVCLVAVPWCEQDLYYQSCAVAHQHTSHRCVSLLTVPFLKAHSASHEFLTRYVWGWSRGTALVNAPSTTTADNFSYYSITVPTASVAGIRSDTVRVTPRNAGCDQLLGVVVTYPQIPHSKSTLFGLGRYGRTRRCR